MGESDGRRDGSVMAEERLEMCGQRRVEMRQRKTEIKRKEIRSQKIRQQAVSGHQLPSPLLFHFSHHLSFFTPSMPESRSRNCALWLSCWLVPVIMCGCARNANRCANACKANRRRPANTHTHRHIQRNSPFHITNTQASFTFSVGIVFPPPAADK